MSASASVLELTPVERRFVSIGGAETARPLPIGLAARIARAAHEAIARVVPSSARPSIIFDWDGGSFRLAPDESDTDRHLADALHRDVVVHRGREGGRLVVSDGTAAFLNGWPLVAGVPQLLGHGDIVRVDDRLIAVRYDPPIRLLVEAGGTSTVPAPCDVAVHFRFAIEPSGEPLELRCDPTLIRALATVVLRHEHDRPFDPTALSDVERATLDWIIHRIADRAAADVFGSRIAFRPAAGGVSLETWASAVVRVGGVHGVVWLGTTSSGRTALATSLEAIAHRQLQANPAVRGIYVTLTAHVDLGRIPASTLATLDAGDILTARDIPWLDDRTWTCRGHLALTGADGLAPLARLDMDEDGNVLATLVAREFDNGENSMATTELPGPLEGVDHPFGSALDAIGVLVAVEVARRRIRLSEALALASGDVIELGSAVTANVSLLIDGEPFARGELVDVDGMLGVRVLTVGGRR